MVVYSSLGKTTKPHRPQEERSFMESCKSLGTIPTSTLSTTPARPPAVRPQPMSINCSSSETPKYLFKSSTSFGHHEPPCHTNHTRDHHLRTSTTTHAHPLLKSSRSSGLYPGTTGIKTSKGCLRDTTTLSQDWEGDQSMPPFTGMTSSLITQSSSFPGDATAPVTRAPSVHERIPTLEGSSPARKHIPSSPEKPSC
jgi:hypothetical protein